MQRRELHLVGFAIVSTIASATSWALWIAGGSRSTFLLTVALHVGGAVLCAALVTSERRSLAFALGLSVPVLGPLAAALSTLVAGRGGTELLHDPHAAPRRIDGTEIARLLTSSLPACEALGSSHVEARRSALAKLTTRAAPDDIAVLRWALTQRGGDAAVEVALACEEIGARFEHRATAARAAAKAAPTFASLSTVFRILTDGITSGTVDGPMVGRLAAEACRHHAAAIALDPARGAELLAQRVRLELAVRRPCEALELLSQPSVDLRAVPELAALYREAAYAARRFDLAPGPVDAYA